MAFKAATQPSPASASLEPISAHRPNQAADAVLSSIAGCQACFSIWIAERGPARHLLNMLGARAGKGGPGRSEDAKHPPLSLASPSSPEQLPLGWPGRVGTARAPAGRCWGGGNIWILGRLGPAGSQGHGWRLAGQGSFF